MDKTKKQAFDEGKRAFEQSRGINVYHVADALEAALEHDDPTSWMLGWLAGLAESGASE